MRKGPWHFQNAHQPTLLNALRAPGTPLVNRHPPFQMEDVVDDALARSEPGATSEGLAAPTPMWIPTAFQPGLDSLQALRAFKQTDKFKGGVKNYRSWITVVLQVQRANGICEEGMLMILLQLLTGEARKYWHDNMQHYQTWEEAVQALQRKYTPYAVDADLWFVLA